MGVYHDSNLRISWRCLHQNYQMNDRAIWFSIIGLALVMGALELSHIQTHMTEKRPNLHFHKVVREATWEVQCLPLHLVLASTETPNAV